MGTMTTSDNPINDNDDGQEKDDRTIEIESRRCEGVREREGERASSRTFFSLSEQS